MRLSAFLPRFTAILALVGALGHPLQAQVARASDGTSAADSADAQHAAWCGDAGYAATVCAVHVLRLPAGTTALTIARTPNGNVTVRGWDGDSAIVHEQIRASAPSQAAAQRMLRDITVTQDGSTLRAEGPRGNGTWEVSYVVDVPRRFDLRAQTENGNLSVSGVTGTLDLRAGNGNLTLDRVAGDVKATTQNGNLAVTLAGARWEGSQLDARTQNGEVTLTIPSRFAAHLVTGTSNGAFRTDVPLPVSIQGERNASLGTQIETDLNGGGPPVRVVTVNGAEVIRRGSE